MGITAFLASWGDYYARHPWYWAQPGDVSTYDVIIIGGGIVGCASALELVHRHPRLRVALVEKKSSLITHQTGQIHAGLYYKPGSLMALLCLDSTILTYKARDSYDIPYGKLVVAKSPLEVERLKVVFERASINGVPGISYLSSLKEIQAIEPHCMGLEAIHSPGTGVVDWGEVANQYAWKFEAKGGSIYLNNEVKAIDTEQGDEILIHGVNGTKIRSKFVISCASLLSVMTRGSLEPKIVPFRGDYFLLSEEEAKLIPSVESGDLRKGPAGVRAMAMNATSSLAIAGNLIDRVEDRFGFPNGYGGVY